MTIEAHSRRMMSAIVNGPSQRKLLAKGIYLQLIAASLLLGMTSAAPAYENHEMWEKIRTRGKLCMRSHEHYGESPALAEQERCSQICAPSLGELYSLGIRQSLGKAPIGGWQKRTLREDREPLDLQGDRAPLPTLEALEQDRSGWNHHSTCSLCWPERSCSKGASWFIQMPAEATN